MSLLTDLADRQLAAYNAADLDAFCACYHPQVRMFVGEDLDAESGEAFRERYADMFAAGGFGATVPSRLSHGPHCVDQEHWWRVDPETGERSEGVLLVRYGLRGDRIGLVQFLDAA